MIEPFRLEVREVELIGDEAVGDMPGERGMARYRRELAGSAAFVRHPVAIADAQRKLRVMIEEKRGDVIVEDEEQNIGLAIGEPLLHRLVPREDRRPNGVVLLVLVQGK